MPDAAQAITGWAALWEQLRKTPPVQWAWILLAVAFGFVLNAGVNEFRESRVALVRLQQDTQERIAERDAIQRQELARERAVWESGNQRLAADMSALKAEITRLILSLDRVTRKLPAIDDVTDRP